MKHWIKYCFLLWGVCVAGCVEQFASYQWGGGESDREWTTEQRADYLFGQYDEHLYPGMSMVRTALCFNDYLKCANDAQREELRQRCLPEWRIFQEDDRWELWHYGYVLRIRFPEGCLLDEPGAGWQVQDRANRGCIRNEKGTYHFEFSYRDSDYDAIAQWSFRAFPVTDGYTLAVEGTGRVEQENSPIRIDYTIDEPLTDKPNGRVIGGVVSLDAYPRPVVEKDTRTSLSMHPAVYGKVRVRYGPEKWVTLEMEGETFVSKLYTTLD